MIKLPPAILLKAVKSRITAIESLIQGEKEAEKRETDSYRKRVRAYNSLPFFKRLFARDPQTELWGMSFIEQTRVRMRIDSWENTIREMKPLLKTLEFAVANGMEDKVELPMEFYTVLDYVERKHD